jgi:hypothetical protein
MGTSESRLTSTLGRKAKLRARLPRAKLIE